uniref:Uncharacterized protein n=1 Tax=Salix viminalis TaxID=40686 RepID=A0A6N2KNM5_SALVM
MASECQGKSSWPELLGAQARVAVVTIETQNPYVDTQVVLEGTPVTKISCAPGFVYGSTKPEL